MLGLNLGLNLGSAALRAGAGVPWLTPSTIVAEPGSGVNGVNQWRCNDISAAGGVMTIDPTVTRRPGVSTLKIDASAATAEGVAYFKTFRHAIPVTALTGAVEMIAKIPVTSAGGISITPRVSSDVVANPPTAAVVNKVDQGFTPDKRQAGDWTSLYWHPDGKLFSSAHPNGIATTFGGTLDRGNIREVEFELSISAATPLAERYIHLDCFALNGRSRPAVVFGFDGFGDASHESIVLPLCQSLNLRGYIAGDGNAAAANVSKLLTFQSAGWPIVSQGMNHTDYALNPAQLSPDFDEASGILEGLNLDSALEFFAYPYNSRSLATDATLLAKGVKWARTIGGNRFPATSIFKPNTLMIGALDIGQKTFAQVKAWIDDAILAGYTLVLYGHTIATTASTSLITATAEFTAIMNYIASLRDAGQIEVLTPVQHARRAA
ncbi:MULTISPECIES: hypothetical protein [unclassified Rhizobium]|uniref:hypothetical protein n=1 Tax=unclassified Rhizobium TaxID=2613769 RepID=UPI000715C98B|nr:MULTISPECIES: hypothetical protein [unclassified Rhizobium]KQT03228.1 hypothetical protein ASG42_24790 [Rhizobium sp. Leaf391]KQU08377.1 hypothetical protein ASG68_22570 [Rhizobium sp. Leaf453]